MGLLQRAAGASAVYKPDPMAEALVERIIRLAPANNRIYTVLSLLKTYTPFQGAIVLEQRDNICTAKEILGLDIPSFSVPMPEITSLLPSQEGAWFSADFIKNKDIFSHTYIKSARAYLLHRSSERSLSIVFLEDPEEKIAYADLSWILEHIRSLFLTDIKSEDKRWNPSEWIHTVFSELLQPGATLSFGIFEKPQNLEALEKALGKKARLHMLDDQRLLVVTESAIDPQLLFHRIQNSFNIKLLDSFETADSLVALERIA
ncbi:hypothetical protein [Gracilinema caldarium]|uniref:hypothetical protein n=1 Tax=Gracilinema caldarium TaxID=215591 RepID=UPI0026F27C02|nr:hypothetical protein [Gracilinema caldarium]